MSDEHSEDANGPDAGVSAPAVSQIAATEPGAKVLTPAARRALAEAEERARARKLQPPLPPEIHGRDGPEPTRFGDWERKGIASDF